MQNSFSFLPPLPTCGDFTPWVNEEKNIAALQTVSITFPERYDASFNFFLLFEDQNFGWEIWQETLDVRRFFKANTEMMCSFFSISLAQICKIFLVEINVYWTD